MRLYFIFLMYTFSHFAYSQEAYDPEADAAAQLNGAIEKAMQENKHVLVQVGGNWCNWCLKLSAFLRDHPSLDSLVQADYVYVKINFSKENRNPDIMKILEYPQRFGFPVLVIIDGSGKRIHTQNTAYLEEGASYSEKIIKEFLISWNKAAMDPGRY